MLLENPATYVEFSASSMDEADFISEVVARSGCGLLLDVNNVHVSCTNHGRDARDTIRRLPLDAVAQIHLAGFAVESDSLGAPLLIDSHGAPVAEEVWQLYCHALDWVGRTPTLIERDNDIPALPVLLAEAAHADNILCRLAPMRHHEAVRMSIHASFSDALLDPAAPCPPGLSSWNGSDPAQRFAIYRNNVVVGLVDALADTYPVTQELVGEAFFRAMVREFVRAAPPRSPVLALYGQGFAEFIESFPPAAGLPYLAEVARLEMLRVRAWHAADAVPVTHKALATALADP
jgi:hypothetical protein